MKRLMELGMVFCLMLTGCSVQESSAAEAGSASDEPVTYACRTLNYYNYANAVPETAAKDSSYFNTTFFAGDSRVGSLYLFSDLQDMGAEIHYTTSLSLWRIYDLEADDTDGTIYDLIMDTDRKNIYLLIGINEIRNDSFDAWKDEYGLLIDEIREKHPGCSIYLIESYMPREISGLEEDEMRDHVNSENEKIRELALEKMVYYIDLDPLLADGEGLVNEDLVWDGLHLNLEGSQMFADYMKTHAVGEDVYVKEVCE